MKQILSSVLLSLLTVSMLLLSSCTKEDKPQQKVEIKLNSPLSMTIAMGQYVKLKVTTEPETILNWSSKNPTVVKVNQSGELWAMQEGVTQVVISAEKAKDVVIDVEVKKSELPLLKFVKNDLDEDIVSYEKNVGRVFNREINFLNRSRFPGYLNVDLPTIPVVIYGIANKTHKIIMCYSKETLDRFERTEKLMLDAGFGKPERVTLEPDGDPAIKWQKGNIEAILFSFIHKEYGTRTVLQFMEEGQYSKEEKIVEVLHPVVEDVKDFPSMQALTGSLEDIESFEKGLGFRERGKASNPENPAYYPLEEKTMLSNFDAVIYIRKPQQQKERPYLNTRLNCLAKVEDVKNESFNKWIRLNCGEGGEWKLNANKTKAQLLTKTHLLVVYLSGEYILMQIFDPAVLNGTSKQLTL
ncbi:Uncharacterised protein [Porphyromonas crevioricanis]|uniref:BIG2 domain-containing protein n=4 Tax=Porphyromonas crevioricanis TaxID=393921 RepID=A0A2X4PLN2_9PORP|nr:hypothetical protein SAMN02745203_01416 [Porphyromonas crevioricanis]SQH72713.1 Uncharacterised protein [Porphyromonas crevioricanis]